MYRQLQQPIMTQGMNESYVRNTAQKMSKEYDDSCKRQCNAINDKKTKGEKKSFNVCWLLYADEMNQTKQTLRRH